jgi:hypothetical protein
LSVAAWWHDAEGRKGKTVTAVKKALENRKLSLKFADKVILIINQHSYGEKQTTTESKVLFDADKLEYVNPNRMLWVKQSFKDGFLTQKQYREYYRYWREKISKVPASMHFAYSRLEYNKMKKQVMEKYRKILGFRSYFPTGRVNINAVPLPRVDSTQILPLCISIICFDTKW